MGQTLTSKRTPAIIGVVVVIAVIIAVAIFMTGDDDTGTPGQISDQLSTTLKNAEAAAESYATDNSGSYEGLSAANLVDYGFEPVGDATVTYVAATFDSYCIEGTEASITAHVDNENSTPRRGPC